MIKKVLASFNIGAAKVDTMLDKSVYRQGETMKGAIEIQGGQVEQDIKDIYLKFCAKDPDGEIHVWQEVKLDGIGVIHPGEKKQFSFQLELEDTFPVSEGGFKTFVRTGLDIDDAIDPTDYDPYYIEPHPKLRVVFRVMDKLGFTRNGVGYTVEYAYDGFVKATPFHQKFFFDIPAPFNAALSRCAVVYLGYGNFVLELERQTKGLDGAIQDLLDLDELKKRFVVHDADVQDEGARLTILIDKMFEVLALKLKPAQKNQLL